MGYQILKLEHRFRLDPTYVLRDMALSAPSQSLHGLPSSCRAEVEEALLIDLVEDSKDHSVCNRNSLDDK